GASRAAEAACRRPPAAERRRVLPPLGSRARAPRPRRNAARRAVDLPSLAGRRARRGGDRRNVAASPGIPERPPVATAHPRRTRRGRGGGALTAPAGRGTDLRAVERLKHAGAQGALCTRRLQVVPCSTIA